MTLPVKDPVPATSQEPSPEVNNAVATVRGYLRDYPELNRLTAGVEHSNRQIVWAILDALSDWNATPPLLGGFSIQQVPPHLLVRGAAISLLESLGILQTRNHLQFSDGGIQVSVNDKTPYIQSWLQLLKNSYEQKKRDYKIAVNIESAWGGGVPSEFAWLSDYYLSI